MEQQRSRIDSSSVGDPARYQTLDHLERGLAMLPSTPKNTGRVGLIVRRREGDLRHRNLRGIYLCVVEGGEVGPGDPVEVIARATQKPIAD